MQKIITWILVIVFLVLLYLNFGITNNSQIVKSLENKEDKPILAKKDTVKPSHTHEKGENNLSTKVNATLTFFDEQLDSEYRSLIERNEPLIISILLPSYYSDDFIKGLESKFETNTVQFKRIDINNNTTNLETLSVYENSNAVILSALQFQDYKDEVLPRHNLNKILESYITFRNSGMTTIVLTDPNAPQHHNLEAVLLRDQEYMSINDFYYINNINVEAASMYETNTNTLSSQVENQIQENIKNFLVK